MIPYLSQIRTLINPLLLQLTPIHPQIHKQCLEDMRTMANNTEMDFFCPVCNDQYALELVPRIAEVVATGIDVGRMLASGVLFPWFALKGEFRMACATQLGLLAMVVIGVATCFGFIRTKAVHRFKEFAWERNITLFSYWMSFAQVFYLGFWYATSLSWSWDASRLFPSIIALGVSQVASALAFGVVRFSLRLQLDDELAVFIIMVSGWMLSSMIDIQASSHVTTGKQLELAGSASAAPFQNGVNMA